MGYEIPCPRLETLFNSPQPFRGKIPPIHYASEKGSGPVIAQLLEHVPTEQVMQTDLIGRFPLHWACKSGSIDCVNELLKVTPELQVIQRDRIEDGLPLFWACKSGSEAIVKVLVPHET